MAKSSKRPQADPQQTSISGSNPYSSSATGGYDRDRVAARAYELYMQRGGGDGNDMEDWFAAEREFASNGDSPPDRGSSANRDAQEASK